MIKSLYRKIIPIAVRKKRWEYQVRFSDYFLKRKILTFLKYNWNMFDRGGRDIYEFLKSNRFSVFPYEWTKKYNPKNIAVYSDESLGMRYVMRENKRLYFKHDMDEETIKNYYSGLLLEQDIDSPHRYEYGDFEIDNGDIVVDAGVAEGNFALDAVERAKTLYLFEADETWLPVLKKTFEPWKEKVVIVNKYVSDTNGENTARLDDYFSGKEINFLKIDVEGAEARVLKGAESLLRNSGHIKTAVCAYHRQHDAEEIGKILNDMGFTMEFSKGYMIYRGDKFLKAPYLRRGLIRGVKK